MTQQAYPPPQYGQQPVQQYPPVPGYPQQFPPQQAFPPQGYQQYPPQQPYPQQGYPQQPPAQPLATGTLDDFFNQPSAGGGPSVSWAEKPLNHTIVGIVTRPIGNGDIQQQTNPQGVPQVFRDGRAKLLMKVPLQMQPTQEIPDGLATWYVKGQARDELVRAMAEAGVTEPVPQQGAVIQVTLVNRRPSGAGFHPANVFQVRYTPPNDGGQPAAVPPAAPAPPVQQQPPAPAPQPQVTYNQSPVQQQQYAQPQVPQHAPPVQYQPAAPAPPQAPPVQYQQPPQGAPQAVTVATSPAPGLPTAGDLDPERQALLARLTGQQVQQQAPAQPPQQ